MRPGAWPTSWEVWMCAVGLCIACTPVAARADASSSYARAVARAQPSASELSAVPPKAEEADAAPSPSDSSPQTRPGEGQAEDLSSSAYRHAIQEAIREFNAGRFAEAHTLFLHAHRLAPSARTLRGLGMSEFELRNYPQSIRYLEQALASDVRALDPKLRAQTEDLLGRAKAFVGRVRLHITPELASVHVDGTPARTEGNEVWLSVGEHLVEVRAPGYRPERRPIRVLGGQELNLHVLLSLRVELMDPPSPAQPTPPSERKPTYKRAWPWLLVGAAVAGAVTAGMLLRPDHPSEKPETDWEL